MRNHWKQVILLTVLCLFGFAIYGKAVSMERSYNQIALSASASPTITKLFANGIPPIPAYTSYESVNEIPGNPDFKADFKTSAQPNLLNMEHGHVIPIPATWDTKVIPIPTEWDAEIIFIYSNE